MKTILRTFAEGNTLMINKTVVKRIIGQGTGDLRPEPLEIKDVCLYLDNFKTPKAILLHRCLYLLSQKDISKANLISKELKKKHNVEISYPSSWVKDVDQTEIEFRQKKAILVALVIITTILLTTLS